jgi:hypothetical protein
VASCQGLFPRCCSSPGTHRPFPVRPQWQCVADVCSFRLLCTASAWTACRFAGANARRVRSQQFAQAKLTIRHITVDEEHDGALFFWHFANKHIADRPRTVCPKVPSHSVGILIAGDMAEWRAWVFKRRCTSSVATGSNDRVR